MNQQAKATIPTVIVVFGATGDLMAKKIAPSLFHLYEKNKLPRYFRILGVSRRDLNQAEFQQHIRQILAKHKDIASDNKKINGFLKLFYYHQGQFQSKKLYKDIHHQVSKIDDKWKVCSNRLFYLAVPPQLYQLIFNNLASSGLTQPCSAEEGWSRVLVEKPFGDDLKTAKALDDLLGSLFREEQIFRIDHYLAKGMLQNILAIRFSNNIFEQTFSNRFIASIDLELLEKKGVEKRGSFYDSVGTLKDVGQNHLLQMLSLTTMAQPFTYDAVAIRAKRAEILEHLIPLTKTEIKQNTFRAQYQGYTKIKGVDAKSKTETYFRLKCFLDHPRWQGVPITIESGKRLANASKKIVLTIKHSMPCLCPGGPDGQEHYQNKIIFNLAPTEGISIEFWAKKPGLEWQIELQELSYQFNKDEEFPQYVEEYEKLLFDCIIGDQTLFVSTAEVEAMWKFIDPIEDAWGKNLVPLDRYKPDSNKILDKASLSLQAAKSKVQGMPREIAIVGLGKMGSGLARQLLEKNWKVHGYNRSPAVTKKLEPEGLIGTYSLAELVKDLPSPKVVWLMVPAGKPVDENLAGLAKVLTKGDIVIDGGNSFYQNTIKRGKKLAQKKIIYVDAGVSGGPEGARHGACIMVGGKKSDYNYLLPLFSDLVVYQGVEHFEGLGAGHFVKMVHNGIEYGMMQAIAEGFDILKRSEYRFHLRKVASVYNHGSVIESALIGWMYDAFELFGDSLKGVSGSAKESGEGRWTTQVAHAMGVPDKVIRNALRARKKSQKNPNYQGKIISALRNQFGGHSLK